MWTLALTGISRHVASPRSALCRRSAPAPRALTSQVSSSGSSGSLPPFLRPLSTMATSFVGAIDQGTTSSRFIAFDHSGNIAATHQLEHKQIYQQPGWCEHDADEITRNVETCVREALSKGGIELAAAGHRHHQPARDGAHLGPRDGQAALQRHRVARHAHDRDRAPPQERRGRGLPGHGRGPLPRRDGPAHRHLLLGRQDHVDARERARPARQGRGGRRALRKHGHVAHLEAQRRRARRRARDRRDQRLAHEPHAPRQPPVGRRHPQVPQHPQGDAAEHPLQLEVYASGHKDSVVPGIPISGDLGDQQAALFGQTCFRPARPRTRTARAVSS